MGSDGLDPDSTRCELVGADKDGAGRRQVTYGRLLRECTPLIRRVVRRGLQPDRVGDIVQDVLLTIH